MNKSSEEILSDRVIDLREFNDKRGIIHEALVSVASGGRLKSRFLSDEDKITEFKDEHYDEVLRIALNTIFYQAANEYHAHLVNEANFAMERVKQSIR